MPSPSTSALKAYDEIYSGDPGNMQVLRDLFPLDGNVGLRKQHCCRSAA
jgi:hypothetical protein